MFACNSCGYKSIKWLGKCPVCESWESFIEEEVLISKNGPEWLSSRPTLLKEVSSQKTERISTRIAELDKVLGGGLVRGEVILVGGEPGVGKSTLLLETGSKLSEVSKVLYVSAEESTEQVSLRAKRLNISADNLYFLNEDNLENIYRHLKEEKFDFLIVDSIQAVCHPGINAQKGSVSQIKGCADFLTRIAKTSGVVVFIVGHVTKDGSIAGPKLLEHIVDCVLYFESEILSTYRILRATKNRFGPAGELAAFEMTSLGLREVKSLFDLFLPHKDKTIAGSCIVCVVEGIRPIILELQSLAGRSGFGMVRRRSIGFDFNRFCLLIAIIEKRLKIPLSSEDVFFNVSGGIKINDPSADLGACLAIISSYKEKTTPLGFIFLGEVGLGAEIRPISNINLRLKAIKRGGIFKKVFIPQVNLKEVEVNLGDVKIKGVSALKEVVQEIWE
ncbi:MAG: DNA repair protein RadA [Candidatus Omnitrophica bacterium]|nr:DNA repair protein RadA [Candidatus Omnitrophota bacterium]